MLFRSKNESLPVNRPAVSFKEQLSPVELATERIYVKTFRKHDSVDKNSGAAIVLRKKVRIKQKYKGRNKNEWTELLFFL